jgi:hypothetical protein
MNPEIAEKRSTPNLPGKRGVAGSIAPVAAATRLTFDSVCPTRTDVAAMARRTCTSSNDLVVLRWRAPLKLEIFAAILAEFADGSPCRELPSFPVAVIAVRRQACRCPSAAASRHRR